MINCYSVLSDLHLKIDGYWGRRCLTQLRYLSEMNKNNGGAFEPLLTNCALMMQERFASDGTITKKTAKEIESMLAPASTEAKKIKVSCIGHAHIDMNWMWSFDETVSITINTLRTMLMLMREYPSFTFAQSQASVYKIIDDYAPELLSEIRERIQEGRWEVTAATWVEADRNMPNGESVSRQLLYTRKYLKELLGLTDEQFLIDFEPDTFGHGANIPEILVSGGIKYYYHCRGYDGHNLYRWRAPSGSQLTVFREPTWYNDTIQDETFLYIPDFCAKNGLTQMLHVYGVGDHGGGATRRDIERIMDMDTWPCMPRLSFGHYIDFFNYIDTLDLPVVEDELNPVFDGCYTSQSRIKKANKVAEAALYDAEALNTAAALCGAYPYDRDKFSDAWTKVLFNQFHDILPGSGVIGTREYAMGLFQETMATAGSRKEAAARAVSACINTATLIENGPDDFAESVSEGAGVGFGVSGFQYTASSSTRGIQRLFHLFNPAQAEYIGCTALVVWDWPCTPDTVSICDETGTEIPFELLDKMPQTYWGHTYFRVLVQCLVPAFGYRTLVLDRTPKRPPYRHFNDPRKGRAHEVILENELIRAEFDPVNMALVSLIDKSNGREYVDASGSGFVYMEEDNSAQMTAWIVGRHNTTKPVADSLRLCECVHGKLRQSFSYETLINNSKLNVTVSLDKNERRLHYEVECRWREFGTKETGIPQLSFRLLLSDFCGRFLYDNACGAIWREAQDIDFPASSFAFAPFDKGGLMLVSDSKYGFRCRDNTIALNLIRSSYDPDPAPECYDHRFSFGIGIEPESSVQSLLESAAMFRRPVFAVDTQVREGKLPPNGQFCYLEEGNVMVSAIKMDENDNDTVVLRLYETTGKDGSAAFRFMIPPVEAWCADIHEKKHPNSQLTLDGTRLYIPLRANGVTTVCIRF